MLLSWRFEDIHVEAQVYILTVYQLKETFLKYGSLRNLVLCKLRRLLKLTVGDKKALIKEIIING